VVRIRAAVGVGRRADTSATSPVSLATHLSRPRADDQWQERGQEEPFPTSKAEWSRRVEPSRSASNMRMAALGTELPICYVNASVAIGGTADPDQTMPNKLDL
jgi:hypothetical protein